jgi:hypothetical protein
VLSNRAMGMSSWGCLQGVAASSGRSEGLYVSPKLYEYSMTRIYQKRQVPHALAILNAGT